MNNRESAGLCRKWARRIRRDSADPESCERGRLHTRQILPEGGSLYRYCAYGYAVEAASGETGNDNAWERAGSEDIEDRLVYADAGLAVSRPNSETLDCFALWPVHNPAALMILAGEEPSRELSGLDGQDHVFIPAAALSAPEEFGAGKPGVIEVEGKLYVELAALSDAGQRFRNDIARFLENHAAWLEAQ